MQVLNLLIMSFMITTDIHCNSAAIRAIFLPYSNAIHECQTPCTLHDHDMLFVLFQYGRYWRQYSVYCLRAKWQHRGRLTTAQYSTLKTRVNSMTHYKVSQIPARVLYSSLHACNVIFDAQSQCFSIICQLPHADVVALTGCARSSLGVCASSSGAIAGLLLWQV